MNHQAKNQSRSKKTIACWLRAIFQRAVLGSLVWTAVWAAQTNAQDWPIGNPPVAQPVPQYYPSYPLDSSSDLNSHPIPPNHPPSSAQPLLTDPRIAPQSRQTAPGFSAANAAAQVGIERNSPTFNNEKLGVDNSLYRDYSLFPVDPRKPCNVCTRPVAVQAKTKLDLPGLRGLPFQDKEPGGCRCGNKSSPGFNQISANWSAPFSAWHDRNHPSSSELRDSRCQPKRWLDTFDSLADFKPVHYQRRDNGYCGPGSDPYGCLGESRQISRVAGVDYRWPGTPAAAPAPFNR